MRGFPGSRQTPKAKHIQSAQKYQIHMESMTCPVMFGNGFLIGTIKIITRRALIPIRKVLYPAGLKYKEEVLGLTLQTIIHQAIEWCMDLLEKMSLTDLGAPKQNDF